MRLRGDTLAVLHVINANRGCPRSSTSVTVGGQQSLLQPAPRQASASQQRSISQWVRVTGRPIDQRPGSTRGTYRDAAEWSEIRNRIIEQGMPIRQVARKCGASRSTVRKMLKHPLPEPYAGADRVRPKLGPYTASIGRLLHEKHLHPAFGRAVRSRNLRAYPRRPGFSGTYRTVLRYAQSLLPTAAIVGQSACDLLPRRRKRHAIFCS